VPAKPLDIEEESKREGKTTKSEYTDFESENYEPTAKPLQSQSEKTNH
jgi:hypothetical protein